MVDAASDPVCVPVCGWCASEQMRPFTLVTQRVTHGHPEGFRAVYARGPRPRQCPDMRKPRPGGRGL